MLYRKSSFTTSNHGFSVLELLVAIAIVSTLTAIAIPKFQDMRVSYNISKAEELFTAVIRQAKELALAEGAEVYISISGSNTFDIGIDRAPYSNSNEPDESVFTRQLPPGITTEIFQIIKFDSRGMLRDEWGYPSWAWSNIYLQEQVIGGTQIDPSGAVEHYSYM